MTSYLTKLASIGEQIAESIVADPIRPSGPQFTCGAGSELIELLRIKNGFYALESALLLRPLSNEVPALGIREWNVQNLWRDSYDMLLDDALFFAEDLFGGQFCIKDGAIQYFEPETGLFEVRASSLEEWAELLLNEQLNYWTGFSLGHEWQVRNHPLLPGSRLLPKVPFICEGKYEVGNLYMSDDITGMRFRAAFANQIRNVPDGGTIIITTRENNTQWGQPAS